MNHAENLSREIPRGGLSVLLSLALVMFLASPALLLAPAKRAEAVGEDAGSWSIVVKTSSTKNVDGCFLTSDGTMAYCYRYGVKGPGSEGTTYTHMKRGTPVTDYIYAKGYPATRHIAGETWSHENAHHITQGAAWLSSPYNDVTVSDLRSRYNDTVAEAAAAFLKEAKAYAKKYEKGERDDEVDGASCVIFVDGKTNVQPMFTGNYFGQVRLKKVPDGRGKELAKTNPLYKIAPGSFAYKLYKDDGDGKFDAKKDAPYRSEDNHYTYRGTDSDEEKDVAPGTYWLVETKAPPLYKKDPKPHRVSVKAGKTKTVKVEEEPIVMEIGVLLSKVDADSGAPQPEGNASLEGAQFTIEQHVAVTDEKTGEPTGEKKLVGSWTRSTDAAGRLDTSGIVFTAGDYTVTETVPPKGYDLPKTGNPWTFSLGQASGSETLEMGNALQDGPHELGDPVQRGGLMIGKGDSERYEHADGTYYDYAQGDASFEGAEFTIYNESESPVLVDVDGNGSFEDDESFAPQSAIQTIATSYDAELDAWVARTPKEHLPFGSYRVKETKAPEGYLNAGTIERAFEIGKGGDYIQLVRDEGALNEVVTGGVMLQKHDLELGRSEALGGHAHSTLGAAGHRGTSLAGIEFDLVNESSHGVMVNGSYFGTGQKVMTLTTAWNPEKGAYTAQTGAHTLPYGTYSLKETKTNESYLLSDGKARTFQIREHGKVVETDVEGAALTWKDQVVRNDVALKKKAAGSSEKLAGVPFLITNVTTGEAHVAVTDVNGLLNTDADPVAHTSDTNANDALASKDDIRQGEVKMDAGVWFALGEDGAKADPDDGLGALPYGHYTIRELECEANRGYRMWSESFTVSRDTTATKYEVDLGTVDDEAEVHEEISTTAADADDGDKALAASAQARVVDIVSHTGLSTGKAYTLVGTLVSKRTGQVLKDASGHDIGAEKTFVPRTADGAVELEIAFDASALAGEELVVFERLSADGAPVCAHEDLDDEGQTVKVAPFIKTSARDKADGDGYVTGTEATVVDTVAYEGLVAGQKYLLSGRLAYAGTGEEARDSRGQAVSATAEFTAQDRTGTAELEIPLDTTAFAGHDLVVFERCTDSSGNLVASHEDAGDAAQTVKVVSLQTTATDAADADKIVDGSSQTATVTDKVSYENLEPGQTYTVSGVLMDKETGEAARTKAGELRAETTFVAEAAAGTVDVPFDLDATQLSGKYLVAFETLSHEGLEVASHADIDDAEQTVSVSDYEPVSGTDEEEGAGDEETRESVETVRTPSTSVATPKTGDSALGYAAAFALATALACYVASRLYRKKIGFTRDGDES